jgi:hypothetical protein
MVVLSFFPEGDMDLWTNYQGQRYHVLGLTISDPDLIKRTKNVIVACAAVAVISVLTTLLEFKMRDSKTAGVLQVVMGLFSSLSAPAFGYFGARRGSATLMCLFVSLMVVLAGISATIMLAVISSWNYIMWNLRNTVYVLLWVLCGAFSAWAAFNGNKLFAKLLQGEQIIENADPEIGLPEIDTQLPVFDAPTGLGKRRVRDDDVDENFHQDEVELKPIPPLPMQQQQQRRPSQSKE